MYEYNVYVYIYICIYVCLHIFIYIYMNIYIYTHVYIHIYIYIPVDPCSKLFATLPMSALRHNIRNVSSQTRHSYMTQPKKSYMEF